MTKNTLIETMKNLRLFSTGVGMVSLIFLLSYCQSKKSGETLSNTPTTQQISAETTFKYAKGLSVQYFENYKLLQLFRTTREAQDTLTYILINKGLKPPQDFDSEQVIEVPIQNVIPLSSTFLEPLIQLGLSKSILAIQNKEFVTQESLIDLFEKKQIPEVGSDEQLDQEKVLSLNPDLIMTNGFDPGKALSSLQSLGLKVIPNLDWQETTPLGRAEWVKYIALLFGKEKEASLLFNEIEKKYLEIVKLTKNVKQKPNVLVGLPFKGTWYVSGGNSYIANMLRDAGTEYHWYKDSTTGAIPLDLESVYPIALEADYWVNTGLAHKKSEILALDSRFADFYAFKNNQTYNNNLKTNAQGGNDYWNSGVLNPHLVLSDFVKIFHPDILPDYELTYYKKLTD